MPLRAGMVWLLLAGATVGAAVLGHGHHDRAATGTTVAVLVIAFVKVRLIATEFMELRHAPRGLRLIVDGWLAATATLLLSTYLIGG